MYESRTKVVVAATALLLLIGYGMYSSLESSHINIYQYIWPTVVVLSLVFTFIYTKRESELGSPLLKENGDLVIFRPLGVVEIQSDSISGFRQIKDKIVVHGLSGEVLASIENDNAEGLVDKLANIYQDLDLVDYDLVSNSMAAELSVLSVFKPTRIKVAALIWLLCGCSLSLLVLAIFEYAEIISLAYRGPIALGLASVYILTLTIYKWSKGMAEITRHEDSPYYYPTLLVPIGVGSICLGFYGFSTYPVSSRGFLHLAMLTLPAVLWVALFSGVNFLNFSKYAVIITMTPIWLYGSLLHLNGSISTPNTIVYVTKSRAVNVKNTRGGKTYTIEIAPWREGVDSLKHGTNKGLYNYSKKDMPVKVIEKTGFLGIPWIEDVRMLSKKDRNEIESISLPIRISD